MREDKPIDKATISHDLTEPAAESYPADATAEKAKQRSRATRLLEILDLERIEENLYRGHNEVSGRFRLFGGQVLAQALRAASNTHFFRFNQ